MTDYPAKCFVNSHDLESFTNVTRYGDFAGPLLAPGTLRGTLPTLGGADGSDPYDLPIAAYPFTLQFTIKADTRHAAVAALFNFVTTIRGSSSVCTLERQFVNSAGTGYDTWTAPGQIVGYPCKWENPQIGRLDLMLVNMKGLWTTDGGTTWVAL